MPPNLNRQLPRIDASRFSMVPRGDVQRSTFTTTHSLKSTFDSGYLIPIHVDEVLPGDVHRGNVTIFARLSTPLFPVMDQISLETFFFFVPCRLLWTNWKKMMGERVNPADSISYTIPQTAQGGTSTGEPVASIWDYMGLPSTGQLPSGALMHPVNALPLRAYNLIWNDWFRDQNLQNIATMLVDDGPDPLATYALRKRNKKHDYFTSALPWPLKGGVEVSMPLTGFAFIDGLAVPTATDPTDGAPAGTRDSSGDTPGGDWAGYVSTATAATVFIRMASAGSGGSPNVRADLSTATGATINAMRLAVQTQRLLERDARSGTRYTELLRAHFGVTPEDSRLQRPEYIGGGTTELQTSAIPQTSATGLTGGSSPLGALGAAAIASDQHSFSYHATEHGYIIGLANVRAELTYQQGVHRLWTRLTRYDFYWPVFAHLGEQVVRNDEIYTRGTAVALADEAAAFGYQERWAEYRHRPSRITGMFRSTAAGTLDPWHLAQKFTALPVLNTSFMEEAPPVARVLAAGTQADKMQILFDSVWRIKTTRPLPMFSVPGMMDRF